MKLGENTIMDIEVTPTGYLAEVTKIEILFKSMI
jgi:hypothetical protein